MAKKKKGKSRKKKPSRSEQKSDVPTVDPELLGRRLRPIYKAVDAKNFQRAVKLIEQAQAKMGPQEMLLVLKAIAYQRCDKTAEAIDAIEEVHRRKPTDLQVLSTMVLVYKRFGSFQKIVEMYHNAVKQKPDDKDLNVLLFESYGRVRNYQKQQQVATTLHKLATKTFQKNKYLYWAVLCKELQVDCVDDSVVRTEMLKGGQTLMEEAFAEAREQALDISAESLLLYLTNLKKQGKHREIIEALSSPLTEPLKDVILRYDLLIDAHKSLGDWKTISKIYREMMDTIPEASDNWNLLSSYLECQLRLINKVHTNEVLASTSFASTADVNEAQTVNETGHTNSTSDDDAAEHCSNLDGQDQTNHVQDEKQDTTIEGLRSFVADLQKKDLESGTKLRRNSALLELELEYQLHKSIVDYSRDKVPDLIFKYYQHFGSKNCFFMDVSKYLDLVGDLDARMQIIQKMENFVASKTGKSKRSVEKLIHFKTAIQQVKRYLGLASVTPIEDCEKLVNNLFSQWMTGRNAGTSLEPTENSPGDYILLLCTHCLIDLYNNTLKRKYLLDAIYILETGISSCEFNFQFKLQLCRLYCHPEIGAPLRSQELFDQLDIRNILLDTLSHLWLEDYIRFGLFEEARKLSMKLVTFECNHEREGSTNSQTALKKYNFTKVKEFERFGVRLSNSRQLATSRAALSHCALVQERDKTPHATKNWLMKQKETKPNTDSKESADGKEIRSNEDYTVVASWDPPDRDTQFTSLHLFLNRPAPSTNSSTYHTYVRQSSSFFVDSSQTPTEEQMNGFHKNYLKFRQIVPELLKSALDNNSLKLRKGVILLKETLEGMYLVNLRAVEPSEETKTFSDMHWRLIFLTAETAAVVSESSKSSLEFLSQIYSLPTNLIEEKLSNHEARWSQVQRQFAAIGDLVKDAMSRLITDFSGEEEKDEKIVDVKYVTGQSVAQICIFVSHATNWLTILLQLWLTLALSKKTFVKKMKTTKKKNKKSDENANANEQNTTEIEERAFKVYLSTRDSLASLQLSLSTALFKLSSMLSKIQAIEPQNILIPQESCLDLLKSKDPKSAECLKVSGFVTESLRTSGKNILAVIDSQIAALKQFKI